MKLADENAGQRADMSRVRGVVAVEQARLGQFDNALTTMQPLNKDLQARLCEGAVWLLLQDGKIDLAAQMAGRTADPFWQKKGRLRIAVYKAEQGDVDGAIEIVKHCADDASSKPSTVQKIIRILAGKKDDNGAWKFIGSFPANQQNDLLGYLAKLQLDRGDLEAAKATGVQLTGNPKYYFAEWLAEAQARTGKTNEAIATALAAETISNYSARSSTPCWSRIDSSRRKTC